MRMRNIIIVVCLICVCGAVYGQGTEAQDSIRAIGGWGSIPLLFAAGLPIWVDGITIANGFEVGFVVSTASTALLSGIGALSYSSSADYAAYLTAVGGIATGTILGLPFVLSAISIALVPVAFIIDTVFVYGPATNYQSSLTALLLDLAVEAPNIANTYYGGGAPWGAVITPAIWMLGLGITGLALGSDEPIALGIEDTRGNPIHILPLTTQSGGGVLVHYSY